MVVWCLSVCHARDSSFTVLNFPLLILIMNARSFLSSVSTLYFTTHLLSSPLYPPFLLLFFTPLPSLLYFLSRLVSSLPFSPMFLFSSLPHPPPRIRNGSRLTPNILFGGPAPVSDAVTSGPKARNAFERHKAAMKFVLNNSIVFFFLLFAIVYDRY